MIPPASTFFNLVRNYNPISEETMPQLKSVFGVYGDTVLNQFKRYYRAKNSTDPVKNLGEFFAAIDGELASIEDPGIVSGWMQFFKYQSRNVKNKTIALLGTPKFLNRNFPPSLNTLITPENINTTNTQPSFPEPNPKVPHMISTGMDLPGYIQTNLAIAGHFLVEIFNSNMASALGKLAKNTDPHQGNLVPDNLHPERIGAVASNFLNNAIKTFGAAGNFMAKNVGFNRFSVQNKNISAPNYKLNSSVSKQQVIRVNSLGLPETKDRATLDRFKPIKNG